MKRKNLTATKKVNNKELSFKNLKIKKTYAKFKTVISKEVNKKVLLWPFPVAQIVCLGLFW
jgi:hypothetical protein